GVRCEPPGLGGLRLFHRAHPSSGSSSLPTWSTGALFHPETGMTRPVRGYDVKSADGRRVDRVLGVRGDFVVVKLGRLPGSRRPVPLEFVHPDDVERVVRITVPRAVLRGAPEVNGTLDERAAAAHYGVG